MSPKCAITRRAYSPNAQKKRKKGAPSGYKKSLEQKQAIKKWYGLSEKQFKKYVNETLKKIGKVENVSEELVKKLEKRLDNVIFRLGLAKSRPQARQMVSHGYFLINGKRVNIPSYSVKKEDKVSLKESKKKKTILKDISAELKNREAPVWLLLDREKLEAKVVADPTMEEANPPAEISLVFEFYSR